MILQPLTLGTATGFGHPGCNNRTVDPAVASDTAGIAPNVPPWLRGGADAPVSVWRGTWNAGAALGVINDGGTSPDGNIYTYIYIDTVYIYIWKIYHKYIFCHNNGI